MNKQLLKISIRNKAIFIPSTQANIAFEGLEETTSILLANAKKLGFAFSEELLKAVNATLPTVKVDILEALKEITGVDKNWTPLVKGWDVPTGESFADHFVTFFANVLGTKKGTRLQCGHLIPDNTFPLERYNGCPFCGTPFEAGEIENYGQGSQLKVLELWTEKDLQAYFADLLTSKTALDATQIDSLKILLAHFPLPLQLQVGMKETLMVVIDELVRQERSEEAGVLFKNPNDILRYLWYKKTGFLQVIRPKTIVNRKTQNSQGHLVQANAVLTAKIKAKEELKLKYSRKECRRVAQWMNDLKMDAEKACEIMHPKRGMWVRFIRALRLSEYSRKDGFRNLANMLDIFHNEDYTVWQGRVEHFRLKRDAENTFALLKQRPSAFARSLFANILWFGLNPTLNAFREIADQLPARLLLTLNMYAPFYFNPKTMRSVKPLGGRTKMIPANKLVQLCTGEQLKEMQASIEDLCIGVMKDRFAKAKNENQSMYIDEALFNIPLSIGDRSDNIQDLPSALMGTKFPLEGNKIRLFMQWGNGLPAQHLDMDLSCHVAYPDTMEYCSYSRLNIAGCKHSGDIRQIPEKVGTAEYIEIDVQKLSKKGAKYVTFTCNAYGSGSITPNLVVGWMDSKFPMKISEKTGVAYDPSCVQHQVRITQGLTKGLVFGVLDVEVKEVIWLEMSFGGQVVQGLGMEGVQAFLTKLDSKMNIGNLLTMKAEAQNLQLVNSPERADEVYDVKWAMNTAGVTKLFLD